jgi:hypothetical protein
MDRRSRARKTEMHALGSKIAFSGRNRCSSGARAPSRGCGGSPQQGLDEVTSAPDPWCPATRVPCRIPRPLTGRGPREFCLAGSVCSGAPLFTSMAGTASQPGASFRRARVPLAMESARRSPTTRDGAFAPGTFAFQMGTDAPAPCPQFVPRRPFAAYEPRNAPIFRDFAVIVILWRDRFRARAGVDGYWHDLERARQVKPTCPASACLTTASSTLRATSDCARAGVELS